MIRKGLVVEPKGYDMRKKSRKLNCQVKWGWGALSGKGSDKEVCSCGREPSCQVK